MAANKLEYAREDVQEELRQNLLKGQYKTLLELTEGIENLQACRINYYCPLIAKTEDEQGWELYETDNGLLDDHPDQVTQAVERLNSRDPKNMAEYYDGEKLESAVWDTEMRGGHVYGCIHVRLSEPMTGEETAELKNWITSQNSDGWGEIFEQHPIQTEDGNLYVSFITSYMTISKPTSISPSTRNCKNRSYNLC